MAIFVSTPAKGCPWHGQPPIHLKPPAKGCPCHGAGLGGKRSQDGEAQPAESGGQDARSERPAPWHGQP